MKRLNVKFLGLALALALVAAVALPAGPAQAQGQGQFPIAVVDLSKVLRDSKSGKGIDKNLKDKSTKLEKDMQTKDNELKKLYEDLVKEAQSGKSSKEALEKKERDLQNKIQAFQTQRAKSYEDMSKSAESALKPLQTKTEKAIEQIAKSNGYVVVLNSASVVYSPNSIDITADVVKAVDK